MNPKLEEIINNAENFGQPVLNEIFKLSSKEIKTLVQDILGGWFDEHCSGMIDMGIVKKISKDDEPSQIEICFYDSILIDHFGIHFISEYGQKETLRNFDKYFKMP